VRDTIPELMLDHYGDPQAEYAAARSAAVIFNESGRGKVEVGGRDAARFLHNLCSNDVICLAAGAGCETFLATAKARMIAHLFVFRIGADNQTYWLDTEPQLGGKVLAHLDRYLISERVELADRTAERAHYHLAGPLAAERLQQVLALPIPPPLHAIETAMDSGVSLQVWRRDLLGVPGFDLIGPPDALAGLWQRLIDSGVVRAGRQTREVLRVEAGMPRDGVDLDDNTFVPEAGRTAQAISYTKGCYLGQEPIVMARDRGQINRTLLGVKLPAGPVPAGSLLFRDGKEVGRCCSSVPSPALGMGIALAVLRRGSWEPGIALEVEAAGQRHPAETAELPFVKPTEAAGS
jgi:folate-binding protein YgfZ